MVPEKYEIERIYILDKSDNMPTDEARQGSVIECPECMGEGSVWGSLCSYCIGRGTVYSASIQSSTADNNRMEGAIAPSINFGTHSPSKKMD